jgi:hypothetical protein
MAALGVACSGISDPDAGQTYTNELRFVLPPTSADACVPLAAVEVSAAYRDNGVLLPAPNGTSISVEILTGTGEFGAVLSGVRTAPTINGTARFTDLRINIPGPLFRLNASAAFFTSVPSALFAVAAGGPSRLVFTASPPTVVVGGALPSVRVAVQDACGFTLPGATNAVTITFGTNAGAATLSGTTTAAAVNGIATFADLFVSKPGAAYTLVAAAGSLTGITSTAFTVAGPIAR